MYPDQDQGGSQPHIPQIDEEMRRQQRPGGPLPPALQIVILLASVAAAVLFVVNVVSHWG